MVKKDQWRETRKEGVNMSELIFEIMLAISWVLQLLGVLIILSSNVWFFYKARTGKYRSIKKEFVAKTVMQVHPDDKELVEADANELLKVFILPNLLYKNYRDNMLGVVFTMVGVILGVVTFTQL